MSNVERTLRYRLDTEDKPNRIAVISDIHGNLHALESVLKLTKELEVDKVYCLGDIVGYGAFPNECVDLIRENDIPCVLGNHDQAALDELDISNFNTVAKMAICWTRDQLTEENKEYLRGLPMEISLGDVFLVHASPRNPEDWDYILSIPQAEMNFDFFTEQICCIGHSHQPFIIDFQDEKLVCAEDPEIDIREDSRYLINVGSIGQPRDRNPESCFAVFDRGEKKFELQRRAYDIEAAQNAILDQGLPQVLATRLGYGS